MTSDGPILSWVSDRHLRVELGSDRSAATHRRVRAAFERLRGAGLAGVRDITPAYATLLVAFDAASLDPDVARAGVESALADLGDAPPAADARLVEVPVCYEGDCAPDLQEVAGLCGLTPADVVALHSGAEYVVHFVGFTPGFPYLGGLPAKLAIPRLERPRPRIPIGSVGIAGDQTGIYPHSSPGGWRVIGRTPRRLFNPARSPATLLSMGDRVRLVPIPLEEFRRLTSPQTSTPGSP